MSLRFRRSVKICKGARLNFNKNSLGMSFGGRGYGYSINTKGRKTKHIGIPGTGLSYVATDSQKNNKVVNYQPTSGYMNVKLLMDDDGNMTFYYPDGSEITDQSLINKIKRTPEYRNEKERIQKNHNQRMLDNVIEYNKNNNDLININKLCPDKILNEQNYIDDLQNLKVEVYEKRDFDIPMPTEESVKADLLEIATKEIKSMAVWSLKKKREEYVNSKYDEIYKIRYDYWLKQKDEFEKNEKELEVENNKKFKEEYENTKEYLKNIIAGDDECVCNDIDLWFSELEMPFECNISYDYRRNDNLLLIDLDLPEIEDFPNQKAVQLANGNMKLKDKTQTELYSDYKNYVFGLALFVVGHIFNISPKIHKIVISAYTQRRDKKGQINDDYVYSIKFDRNKLGEMDLIKGDSFNMCMNFENRCNVNANNSLKTIEPYDN